MTSNWPFNMPNRQEDNSALHFSEDHLSTLGFHGRSTLRQYPPQHGRPTSVAGTPIGPPPSSNEYTPIKRPSPAYTHAEASFSGNDHYGGNTGILQQPYSTTQHLVNSSLDSSGRSFHRLCGSEESYRANANVVKIKT